MVLEKQTPKQIIKKIRKEKPNFNKLANEIYEFEKEASFTKTSEKRLISALKNEIKEHETAEQKSKRDKKLINFIILTMQLAKRRNVSLDGLWNKWWLKSEKYLSKNKDKYKKEFDKGLRH